MLSTSLLFRFLTVALLGMAALNSGCADPGEGRTVHFPQGAGRRWADRPVVVKERMRLAGAGLQKLQNGGFETLGAWSPYEKGFVRTPVRPHSGKWAIQCINTTAGEGRGAEQTITLNQTQPAPLVAEAWSRAQGVSGAPDSDYSLYLDLVYMDGTPLWGRITPFGTGTHGWERAEVRVMPDKPVKTVTVYALFRNHTGTARFDDVKLSQFASATSAVFDGVVVSRQTRPIPVAAATTLSLKAGDLELGLNEADGRPMDMSYKNKNVPARGAAGSGFFVRDAAADSDFYGFRASPQKADGGFSQDGAIDPLHLRLHTTYSADDRRIEVSGRVEDTSGTDRAVTVYYALPVAPAGLTWWDTLRESRAVTPGGLYEHTADVGVGNTGAISLLPFSCLSSADMGLSIDLPMDHPRTARIAYDARAGQFYVAFDLGIVPHGPPATFHFFLTATDPAWGLRAAAERYYSIQPDAFQKRVEKEGIWMPFSPISKVDRPEDFGFAFKEGNTETAWDDAHGVATFRYTEPMSFWMDIPTGVDRDYTVATDYLNRYAAGTIGNAETRRMALATQLSGDFGPDGRYNVRIEDQPWAHGALFVNNCNPAIPDSPAQPNRAHVAWTPEIAHSLYDTTTGGVLDGEYLDSIEGWGTDRNFRRAHFPYETESLTFDTATRKPCILQGVSNYEFARSMAADVHKRGKLMFANSTPSQFYWLSGLFDVVGTETHWLAGDQYRPDPDSVMLYRRAMAYHKPYLLLQNSDFNVFSHPMVDQYLKRSLFYGIFPSMFSYNAADKPYWQNPAWYNRDRGLFKQTIPIIQELGNRGWEPVTGARSSDQDVWIERFGGRDNTPPALTILNNASTVRSVQITLEGPSAPASFTDRISGQTVPVTGQSLSLTLEGGGVAALFPKE